MVALEDATAPAIRASQPLPEAPPFGPRHLRLDRATDFRVLHRSGVEVTYEGELRLLRSNPPALVAPSGTLGGKRLPHRMTWAGTPDDLYLLRDHELLRFDACECAFEPVPHTGGSGSAARQWQSPSTVRAVRGELWVLDTGNRRISRFSGPPHWALLGHARPPAPTLAASFAPRDAVELPDLSVVVLDGGFTLHWFTRHGQWLRSALVPPSSAPAPARFLAVSGDGELLIATDSIGLLCSLEGQLLREIATPAELELQPPVPVDAAGNVLLGSCGWFGPDGESTEMVPDDPHYATSGEVVLGPLDSRIARCVWHRVALRARIRSGTSISVQAFGSDRMLPEYAVATLNDLDWGRRHALRAGPRQAPERALDWDALLQAAPGRYCWLRLSFAGPGDASATVGSLVVEFPRLTWRAQLPDVFGLDPIGADFTDRMVSVLQQTDRELDRVIGRLPALVDPLSAPHTRNSTRSPLWFLARWLDAVPPDPGWPLNKQRRWIAGASERIRRKGTAVGVRDALRFALDIEVSKDGCPGVCGEDGTTPVLILEHFRLRRWLHVSAGRLGADSRLWGAAIVNRTQLDRHARVAGSGATSGTQVITSQDPLRDPFHVYAHRFSVFLPECELKDARRRAGIERLVEHLKPAHTEAQLHAVGPRMRIGVQSMIGLDAVVARYPVGAVRLGGEGYAGDRLDGSRVLPGSAEPTVATPQLGGTRVGGDGGSHEDVDQSAETSANHQCSRPCRDPTREGQQMSLHKRCGCSENTPCNCSAPPPEGAFVRNHYFTGKLLVERDFSDEQRYYMEKQRFHARMLHGWGVVCGLNVTQHPDPECRDRYVMLQPGVAIDPWGREIIVSHPVVISLRDSPAIAELDDATHDPRVGVRLCYRECPTEDIPVLYDACGCTDGTAPNRILESFEVELVVEPTVEEPGEPPDDEDPDECEERILRELDVCAELRHDPCLLLAVFPYASGAPVQNDDIHNEVRRRLLPTSTIAKLLDCLSGGGDGSGITEVQVEIVDCEELGGAGFDPDTGVLTLQIPRGCDGEPGESGITEVQVEIVDCEELGGADFDPDTGVLTLQIPRGCDGEPGESLGLPDDLTRIEEHSWTHAATNGDLVNVRFDEGIARGLVIEFTGPVFVNYIDPLHVFRVWVTTPSEDGFTRWAQLPGEVQGVRVIRSGQVITEINAVPDPETKAVAFLLNAKYFNYFERYRGPVRIELHGDFVIDVNRRAIDANYVQAQLPTSDMPNEQVGLPGGTFISWFTKTQRGFVDLNLGTATDVEALPLVGRSLARRIIDARPFSHREELLDIQGITPRVFNAIRDRFTLAEEDES